MAEKYPPEEPDPPDEQTAQVHLVEEEWVVGTEHSFVLQRLLAEVELEPRQLRGWQVHSPQCQASGKAVLLSNCVSGCL